MSELSFKYCPICGKELDTGKTKFPVPWSIFNAIETQGKYYPGKTSKQYEEHPIKKLFKTSDKEFTVKIWRAENPTGY